MRLAKVFCLALALTVGLGTPAVAQAQDGRKVDAEQTKEVQKALKRLGFVNVQTDGASSAQFKNILCSWRELVGKTQTRRQLLPNEAKRILLMQALPTPPRSLVNGLNVNLACQSLTLVQRASGEGRTVTRVFRVSTGMSGYSTSTGKHTIMRRIDGLHNSSTYPSSNGWNMYRPAYFTSWGEAFHGSPSDSSVSWYPSSHGCVRMLQKDIDYLWRHGHNAIGQKVSVYGTWRG